MPVVTPAAETADRPLTPALIRMTRIFVWGSVVALLLAPAMVWLGMVRLMWDGAIGIFGLPIPLVLVFVASIFLLTKYRSLDRTIPRWPFIVALVGLCLAVGLHVLGLASSADWRFNYFAYGWVYWASFTILVVLVALDILGFVVCIRWLRLLKSQKTQYPNPNPYPASGYYLVPVAGTPPGIGDPGVVPAVAGTPGAAPAPVLVAGNPGGFPGFALTPAGVPYQRASRATYLWPIFFGFIGGILGWAIVKDRDPVLGKRVLITGMIIGVVATLLPILFYVGLFVWASNSSGGY